MKIVKIKNSPSIGAAGLLFAQDFHLKFDHSS